MTAPLRMPRLTRIAGRRALIVLTLGIAASASLTSCAPSDTEIVAPPFALTSADVVYPAGQAYPVNLIFAAPADDPIWTDLTGVALPGDASVGPGGFQVIRGEGSDGYDLGNISFDLVPPPEGISFTSVGLVFTETPEPVRVDVGSWTLASAEPEEFATDQVSAAIAAMSACTTADFPLPSSTKTVQAFHSGNSHVEVDGISMDAATDSVRVSLTCDDDADFHIFSPTLDYIDCDGAAQSTRLTPLTIGLQDIDDADFARIRDR